MSNSSNTLEFCSSISNEESELPLEQDRPKKKKKRSPGRPAGSKNKAKAVMAYAPPSCPRCKSQDLIVRGNNPRKDMIGCFEFQGVKYGRVEWKRVECKDCGQITYQRRFHDIIS